MTPIQIVYFRLKVEFMSCEWNALCIVLWLVRNNKSSFYFAADNLLAFVSNAQSDIFPLELQLFLIDARDGAWKLNGSAVVRVFETAAID